MTHNNKDQDELIKFMQDPENIKKAVEGSMDKRLAKMDNNKVPKDLDEIVDSWLDEAKGFTPSDSSLPAEKKTRHISRAEAKQAIAEYTEGKVREQLRIITEHPEDGCVWGVKEVGKRTIECLEWWEAKQPKGDKDER